ncbi:ATP-binding protein [Mucilaginibacter terrae]|uniref:ATP-binding protein n=1 Tax=Mucilaginibacter terrae TaxID=1955052 RepID=UPI00363FA8C9
MVSAKTLEFNNQPQNITGFTRHVLHELSAMLLQYHHNSDLLFKVKIIVTELLNNAVKHSGTQQTELQLHLHSSELIIIKSDAGKPFDLNSQLQKCNTQVMLSSDAMHLLYAVKENDTRIRFYCEENLADTVDVSLLTEHLGLLIITKAADEFIYEYQENDNLFSAKIKLG